MSNKVKVIKIYYYIWHSGFEIFDKSLHSLGFVSESNDFLGIEIITELFNEEIPLRSAICNVFYSSAIHENCKNRSIQNLSLQGLICQWLFNIRNNAKASTKVIYQFCGDRCSSQSVALHRLLATLSDVSPIDIELNQALAQYFGIADYKAYKRDREKILVKLYKDSPPVANKANTKKMIYEVLDLAHDNALRIALVNKLIYEKIQQNSVISSK